MRNLDEKTFAENQSVPIGSILNEGCENELLTPESIFKLYPLLRSAGLRIDRQGDKFSQASHRKSKYEMVL